MALLIALIALAALPARADDVRVERARIAVEQAAVEARHAQAQRECASRFVVTACADEAREQRRIAIAALNRQTLAIDESERRRDAAARLRSIDAKAAAHAGRQAISAASSASDPLPATLVPRGEADPSRPPRSNGTAAAEAARAQQARARAAAARVTEREERRKDADAHRAAVEKRLRDRQASGRAAPRLLDAASGVAR